MECPDILSKLYAWTKSCGLVSVLQERQAARALAVMDDDSPDYTASLYRAADDMSKECGMRLDMLVLYSDELDRLVAGGPGNDVKAILHFGEVVRGRMPAIRGSVETPDPASITEEEMEYNMYLHGFEMMSATGRTIPETAIIRPEYVVAGAMFGMHTRRISSGIPVVLCNADVNYGLLLYVARSYGFAGRLLGIMSDIRAEGRLAGTMDEPISILKKCGTVPRMPFANSVREALDTYAC